MSHSRQIVCAVGAWIKLRAMQTLIAKAATRFDLRSAG